jgi:hypothetical protein
VHPGSRHCTMLPRASRRRSSIPPPTTIRA